MIIDKKIVTLGERASGKTCLIYRYVEGQFQFTRETSGCNYSLKTVETNQYEVRLKFYDTAGQEIYYSIARVYFKGCDAVTLVYRKDSKESFEGLSFWINKVRDFLTEHIPVYLVCTHCDINQGDLIPSELGLKFCEDNRLKGFFEVSSYTGQGVLELYCKIIEDLITNHQKKRRSFKLDEEKKVIKKKGCKC